MSFHGPFAWRRGLGWFAFILLSGAAACFAADAAPQAQPIPAGVQVDRLWVVVAAILVFLMQAGFLCLEVGVVRPKAATITALKNVVDWNVCAATFFFLGFGLMFGDSWHGLFGTDLFLLEGTPPATSSPLGIWVFFLFQLAFAGTAATIVSGALAERTSFYAYLIFSAVITTLIYPVAGHWVWGGSFLQTQTWLSRLGFIDFAGSTQVHSIGGWASLVGIAIVGPRIGRFGPKGEVREWDITGLQWSALGVLILWFSWWGFNGGSTLAMNELVGPVIANTNIAAAFGGIGAIVYSRYAKNSRGISAAFLNGILAGLVGITANCHMVSPWAAVLIGFTSGIISCWAVDVLIRLRLDDPVGAIPVHLFCGVWGTLCVGLFGNSDIIAKSGAGSRIAQIGAQLVGIGAVGAWTVTVSFLTFWFIRKWVGLRVSPEEEQFGYDIAGVAKKPEPEKLPSEEDLRKLLSGDQP